MVCQALDFTPVRNIGAMLAACSVEPMAGGAGGRKNLFALTRAAGRLAGLLRQQWRWQAHVAAHATSTNMESPRILRAIRLFSFYGDG